MKRLLVFPYHLPIDISFVTDDILEVLIDSLLIFPSLNISSKSTSHYLHKNPLPNDILKEKYKIDFIIEGGIKVVESRLVISSRLLSTKNESILLRLRHSCTQDELPSTLQKLSTEIHEKINATSDIPEYTEVIKETLSKAEEHYLKGVYHWNRYTFEELLMAVKYFKNAIRYDENFVLAYSGIADCYCVIGVMGFELPKTAFELAKSYVQKAFKLNNKRSEIFVSAALVNMFFDRDYALAKINLSQALLLNKASLKAHHTFAMYNLHTNDLHSAEKHALFNIKNAPNEIPHYDMIAKIYLYKKEFDKGLSYAEKALQLDANSIEIKELEGHLNMHLKNYEKAIECYQICLFQNPNNPLYYSNLAYVFSKSNYHLDSRKVLEDMAKLKSRIGNLGTFHYAQSIINLGQLDYKTFFKNINIAFENNLGMFIGELICNPIYNEIRKDKRFNILLKKLKLDFTSQEPTKNKFPASSITFLTKTKEKFVVDPQYLAYIESQGNYSKVYWFDQNVLKNRLLRVALSDLEKQVSNIPYIKRCHKSYIININEHLSISGNTKGHFFESNYYPIRIPISRSKSKKFIEGLSNKNSQH